MDHELGGVIIAALAVYGFYSAIHELVPLSIKLAKLFKRRK